MGLNHKFHGKREKKKVGLTEASSTIQKNKTKQNTKTKTKNIIRPNMKKKNIIRPNMKKR